VKWISGAVVFMLLTAGQGQAACLVTATNVVFGVYNPVSGGSSDFTGTMTLNCTRLSNITGAYTITLSPGSGGYAGRRMFPGGTNLRYQIYADAAHSLIWGDGTGGTSVATGVDNRPLIGGTSIFTIRGRLLPGQTIKPGTYSDVIIASVSY
jgi:spore coat protein U-like protein